MSDTEDIINLYADVSNGELINFAYLYDDKKTSLKDIESRIIDNIHDIDDIDKIKIFYLNHLDLFIKNQSKFKKIIRNQVFLDEYMKYRTAFADIKAYIDSLSLYNTLLSPETPNTPRTPNSIGTPDTPNSILSTSSKSSAKSRFSGFFDKKYPLLSIFNKVEPLEFGKICHKIYLAYYFLIEMREYQYYSRVSTREVKGYAGEFSNFYDNFYRKLESEIEIFCESNSFSLLADTFITLSTYFLDVGNTSLAQICINLMDRFKICKESKIKQFLESQNLTLPLNALSIKNYKKFTYLVEPTSINRAFVTSQETESKIKTFSFIQTKMVKTKEEILSKNITSTKTTYDDFLVFNYINPKIIIKNKLYTSSSPCGIECLCIQQKCKSSQKGKGHFDKKHTKYPRKWSKSYCQKTSCDKMGFSQKASCRYYKNCYK
jgi:hypothetical protein